MSSVFPAGLIPAHAGKTPSDLQAEEMLLAHPRSRGENERKELDRKLAPGSSPLTRGKLNVLQAEGHALGLIPAHAGKTIVCPSARVTSRAHPRSRGENPLGDFVRVREGGSSPLTRGKPSRRRSAGQRRGAHPRSRGENDPPGNPGAPFVGSSPLTRGKHRRQQPSHPERWLIPAHAGKTL